MSVWRLTSMTVYVYVLQSYGYSLWLWLWLESMTRYDYRTVLYSFYTVEWRHHRRHRHPRSIQDRQQVQQKLLGLHQILQDQLHRHPPNQRHARNTSHRPSRYGWGSEQAIPIRLLSTYTTQPKTGMSEHHPTSRWASSNHARHPNQHTA